MYPFQKFWKGSFKVSMWRPHLPPLPPQALATVSECVASSPADTSTEHLLAAAELRSAKRGAAGGPSGMTVEHLQPRLDHPKDLRLFFQVAERLARGQVPEETQVARKADGRVRGVVAGDVVGCECISHVLQALTELNPNATILSVDGMSAYDMMSRKAMLQGLSNVEGGSCLHLGNWHVGDQRSPWLDSV